jgi:hypothetical protein
MREDEYSTRRVWQGYLLIHSQGERQAAAPCQLRPPCPRAPQLWLRPFQQSDCKKLAVESVSK